MTPLTSTERAFFEDLFRTYEEHGVEYLLLRNYQEFPQQIGNDLDLFVTFQQRGRAAALFKRALGRHRGRLRHQHQRYYFQALWFSVHDGTTLHVDLYPGAFTWHGLAFLNPLVLLAESRQYRGYRVPRPAHEALSLCVTAPLWGGFIRERYHSRVLELLAVPEERAVFDRCCCEAFGCCLDPEAIYAAPEEGGRLGRRLRQALKNQAFRASPAGALLAMSRHWAGEWRTVVAPPGRAIAIDHPRGREIALQLEQAFGPLFGKTLLQQRSPNSLPERVKHALLHRKSLALNFLALSQQAPGSRPCLPPDLTVTDRPQRATELAIPPDALLDETTLRSIEARLFHA